MKWLIEMVERRNQAAAQRLRHQIRSLDSMILRTQQELTENQDLMHPDWTNHLSSTLISMNALEEQKNMRLQLIERVCRLERAPIATIEASTGRTLRLV